MERRHVGKGRTVTYDIVNVTPDTDQWLEERRKSVGASEVAAVMGLSKWATPLDIYKSKHGIDRPFDPLISLLGHEAERTLSRWLVELSGLNPNLTDGFMARSREFPFIHATPDRIWDGVPVQIKTAHEFTSQQWDEGIPTEYRVQVQTEMLVTGAPKALLVVQIGARDVRAIWEPRDEKFIRDYLVPAVKDFWDRVQAGEPPEPSTMGELAEVWPADAKEAEVPEFAIEALEKRAFLLASVKEMTEEADQIKLAVGQWMQQEGVDTLTRDGRKFVTYKKQKGRESLDTKALRADHPELVTEYTKQGADFLVMRTHASKEKNNV